MAAAARARIDDRYTERALADTLLAAYTPAPVRADRRQADHEDLTCA
jgi:hypothetical protein